MCPKWTVEISRSRPLLLLCSVPLLPKTPLSPHSSLSFLSFSLSPNLTTERPPNQRLTEARGGSEGASSERIRSGEMLGKRQRSMLMRRTTSVASLPSVAKQVRQASGGDRARAGPSSSASAGAVGTGGATMPMRDASDLAGVMTAAFLTACGFCGKGLGPGKDTYIYRGEVAFCSHECREWQIEQDELMEQNCSLTSIREAAPSAAGGSDQSGSGAGDAVAAA
uniref:Uncharacterized protein n=1 Tax=Avena sativa TaxID=4498 RepID=A0ACD5Z5J8_AVESA